LTLTGASTSLRRFFAQALRQSGNVVVGLHNSRLKLQFA
jgi:hypothetical protein